MDRKKRIFIKDIKEKERVVDLFIVTRKETGVGKSGRPYLSLKLMDATGQMDGRVWEDAERVAARFEKDDVVLVKGYAVSYQGGLQLNISDIERVEEGEYSIRDFLPSSKRPPEEMMAELEGIISAMKDPHLKALLKALFRDSRIREAFMTAPAAKSMHHPYIGGLLEHVLSLVSLIDGLSEHYRKTVNVNRDLLVAGAVLHDIGKIFELKYRRAFDYTDEGKLLGHITMGIELVNGKIREVPDFPGELAMVLKHMILSHHGRLEFGSPKRPKTLEALILYYLDDLDAKVGAVTTLMEGAAEGWSPYQRMFERPIYLGGRPAEEEPSEEAPSQETPETPSEGSAEDEEEELELFKG